MPLYYTISYLFLLIFIYASCFSPGSTGIAGYQLNLSPLRAIPAASHSSKKTLEYLVTAL